MITLYQFLPGWGLPNASPFCMKLENYLRLAKIPYETRSIHDPRPTPKGKLPFIKDDGKVIADSGLIIDYLKTKYGNPLDQHLTSLQKAQALALQRLLEEHLYWTMVYSRWMEPNNWQVIKKDFFGHMPTLLRWFVPDLIRKKLRKTLYAQGMGRHSRDEIYQLGKNDLQALADSLGTQSFIFGEKLTSIDACAYAFLANLLYVPIESPLKSFVSAQPQLISYCERMKLRLQE